MRELSVVLPAFNEEANVAETVTAVAKVLAGLGLDHEEIVVVDDGSVDCTGTIADNLARENEQIRVVHHDVNKGYGAALQSGFAVSRYAWVFFTDSDRQFDVAELDRLWPYAGEYDAVIGYRAQRRDHFGRKLNTLMWKVLIRATVRLNVRDMSCAFKLLRRDQLQAIGPLESHGALVSAELLVKLQRVGAKIKEVPVSHYPRQAGVPTGANPAVVLRAFRELGRLHRELRTPPR